MNYDVIFHVGRNVMALIGCLVIIFGLVVFGAISWNEVKARLFPRDTYLRRK